MSIYIAEPNMSLGWLHAMVYLLECGGKDTNVIVAIQKIGEEDPHIRQMLDEFLDTRPGRKSASVGTVANTIFPQALYRPNLGSAARPHLYDMYRRGFARTRRYPANRTGTYFQRLIDWPGHNGTVNQLEQVIERLRRELAGTNPKSSIYELSLSCDQGAESSNSASQGDGFELRIFHPGLDRRIMGFPCLSHISLTLYRGQLHLTALYRNQHFLRKAYGNYLGLSRLLEFLCEESGCEPGELVCVASHADAEIGKRALTDLIRRCQISAAPNDLVSLSNR